MTVGKFFSNILNPIVWIGKELVHVGEWFPKVFKIASEVEADAPVALAAATKVIEDVSHLAVVAVKDGGADLLSLEKLVAVVVKAAGSKGMDVTDDMAILPAFKEFMTEIGDTSNYLDVLNAIKVLVGDYEALGAVIKPAIERIKDAAK